MYTKNKHIFLAGKQVFWGVALLLAFLFLLAEAQGQEPAEKTDNAPPPAQKNDSEPEQYSEKVKELMQFLSGDTDSFIYQRVGRTDPFMPFIKEKVVTSEVETPEKELFGLQKFEPGQLTLVAVVATEQGTLAMVEDSVGKGYIIKSGTGIGRSGVVDSISGNMVVIKQRYKTAAGEELDKFVEMLLKKEGEK
jgi:type IV pilus assembly protein PilP